MDNILQTALAGAIDSLAGFFGTTTEAIMEHAPEFLAKYGWYDTLSNLPMTILGCILVAALIFLTLELVTLGSIDHHVLIGIIIFVLCIAVGVAVKLVTCAVAPEIVGAHAILELLKATS